MVFPVKKLTGEWTNTTFNNLNTERRFTMADKEFKNDKTDLKKKILQEWADLDQKDLGDVMGSREKLIQKLVRDYGLTYEEAKKRLNEIDD